MYWLVMNKDLIWYIAIEIGLYWLMGCKHINYSYAHANVIV
ncbi:hypothetical protein F383_21412 [Gossypium arboreum]|uniref:Uncharacterized protein n=1 Tax=Gossypium arboreum TaxID=29729 RepID=A0A0B0MGW8_GOSAR|nr:hypothetical protein F383_21412 [Gossypium arboreum]